MNIDTLKFLAMLALLLPSSLIANRSVEGSKAGYFVLHIWVAEAVIYGLFGLTAFICGLFVFFLIGFSFRRKLQIAKWWANRSNRKE